MKRPVRSLIDGTYTVHGKKYKELFGSREQVMNGTAYKTTGGLTTEDLLMNKNGRIVSAVKFKTAKKEKRLEKYGYFAKKGKFGYVKKGSRTPLTPSLTRKEGKSSSKTPSLKRKTRRRKMKGGDEDEEAEIEKDADTDADTDAEEPQKDAEEEKKESEEEKKESEEEKKESEEGSE